MNIVSFVWIVLVVHVFVIISIAGQKWHSDQLVGKSLANYLAGGEDQQQQQQQSAASGSRQMDYSTGAGGGERVDKLSSAIGDQIWRSQQDLYQEALDRLRQERLESLTANIDELNSQYQRLAAANGRSSFQNGGAGRSYHALVDEFKQLSPISNPTREGRAFKPKLMSTARGFGKRSYLVDGQQPHVTFADLFGGANLNGALASNGKMNGNAIRVQPKESPPVVAPANSVMTRQVQNQIKQANNHEQQRAALAAAEARTNNSKPRQIFWEKRLQGQYASINDENYEKFNLPRNIRSLLPEHISDDSVVRAIVASLYDRNTAITVTGQSTPRQEINKNPAVFLDPYQPPTNYISVDDNDLRRQEDRVNHYRRELGKIVDFKNRKPDHQPRPKVEDEKESKKEVKGEAQEVKDRVIETNEIKQVVEVKKE